MLDKIKNNSILIIPRNIKEEIIKELNKTMLNVKIIEKQDFFNKVTFEYTEETIFYLMKKENIKYDIAKNYIENIYYVKSIDYGDVKLNKLVEIKKDLENNGLLIYDNLFKQYIKNKNIYILDEPNKYEKNILNELEKQSNIIYLNKNFNNYTPEIYEFKTITEEIEFVAYKICELLDQSIDINKIKLVNIDNEYINEIKRIFAWYNIPINLNIKHIYGTEIVQKFIENYEDNIENVVNMLKEKYDIKKEDNLKIINKIIEIINKYSWCKQYKEVKELIIDKLKKATIESKIGNAIEIKDLESIKDEYTFILNFNEGSIPKIYKDENYIDDKNCLKLNLETSIEKNIIEKEKTIKNIKNIKNCIITYKLKTPFKNCYKSNIIEQLNNKINKEYKYNNISYSSTMDEIKLTKQIDNLLKYRTQNSLLETLYANYKIPYKKYSNKYTKIDKNNLKKYLNNKLLLSYSSMDNYYRCAFKYYINNILKLNPYEETFATNIGSLFHYVLEKSSKNNDDYKQYWDEYVKSLTLTNKETFLINELEETCKFTVETIKKQLSLISLDKTKYEEKIYVDKSNNTKITFMGVIDKLMYKEDLENTIVAVIDYKTGNADIDLNKACYGLNLQLPVYLYLSTKTKLKNVKIAGFYLQNIINNQNQDKEKNLKLNGYSINDKKILEQFDNSYKDSALIKSMRLKNDGDFYSYSKVLTEKQIENLIKLVDQKIEEASENILNANFEINPKQIGYEANALIGCEYCKFKDICYKQEHDIKILKEQNYNDFLGDEQNA